MIDNDNDSDDDNNNDNQNHWKLMTMTIQNTPQLRTKYGCYCPAQINEQFTWQGSSESNVAKVVHWVDLQAQFC